MTYCVAMRLQAGLVFLSDSRTNAGTVSYTHLTLPTIPLV